jgi:predicted methyltransferase
VALIFPLAKAVKLIGRNVTGVRGDRIEPASVREEVEKAGFVLDEECAILANKNDAHSVKVFDPSIKGETDRFTYRFVKC